MEEGKLLADTGKQINRLYFMMYKYHSPKIYYLMTYASKFRDDIPKYLAHFRKYLTI
jgi:hypothetical protein